MSMTQHELNLSLEQKGLAPLVEPGEVHERCFVGIKTKKISIGQQPRQ